MRSIVYFYTHLQRSFDDLVPLLSGDPGAWLPDPAEPGEGFWLVELRPEGALPKAIGSHPAEVRVGPTATSDVRVLRSVTWRSAASERLVPALQADLEMTSLDGYGCQLSMMGSYRPPLSVVGGAGDRLLGHRVAEACVRRFVLDVASRVDAVTLQA